MPASRPPLRPRALAAPSAREELERRLAESRARRRAAGRPRGAARLKRRPARRVASFARRLPPPHPAGRRRKQHPLPRERADLRRAAGGRSVRPAAAHRADPSGRRPSRAARPSTRPRCSTASSPRTSRPRAAIRSSVIERLLAGSARNRGQLSLYAAPAFLWFSTRLFAGVRTVAQRHLRRLGAAAPPPALPAQLARWPSCGTSVMVIATVSCSWPTPC